LSQSHSHRGFSPVQREHPFTWNRFNGFLWPRYPVAPLQTVKTVDAADNAANLMG